MENTSWHIFPSQTPIWCSLSSEFSFVFGGSVGIAVTTFWNLYSILINLLVLSGAAAVIILYWVRTISPMRSVKVFRDAAIWEIESETNYVLAKGSSWVPTTLLRCGSIQIKIYRSNKSLYAVADLGQARTKSKTKLFSYFNYF